MKIVMLRPAQPLMASAIATAPCVAWLALFVLLLFSVLIGSVVRAGETEAVPADPYFAKFHPAKAPEIGPLLLKSGDRLAICGDSITEQKMYSRIIETYLTVCTSDLKITTRQFGWSGETAEGFRNRMKQDCLRFKPTIATINYGMNDHHYAAYNKSNADWYRDNYTTIVKAFTAAGARVVAGSPGAIGKMPPWAKDNNTSFEDMDVNLCAFRDIVMDIASQEKVRFADVFWPMWTSNFAAHKKYGENYNLMGGDGVHPGWAGHLIMAYAYLRAMGLDGDIGTYTVDLKANKATVSKGHVVNSWAGGKLHLTSTRYPFCATGAVNDEASIRSGMSLVPFTQELNRLTLIVKNGTAASYDVTWGDETHTFTADELAAGVNLADRFTVTPFAAAFKAVDDAVFEKQNYETAQIKGVFHGDEGKADINRAAARTEAERAPLAAAILAALVPVKHQITIVAK